MAAESVSQRAGRLLDECRKILDSNRLSRTEVHRLYRLLYFSGLELDELCKSQPDNSDLHLLRANVQAMQETIICEKPVAATTGRDPKKARKA